MAQPLVLGPNRPKRFYRGGQTIMAFRGLPPGDDWYPEDWIGSTTTLFGQAELGLTRLESGQTLHDAVSKDPAVWLGAEHISRFGPDPALLVKLLHAGERLPVHAHPDHAFTKRELDYKYGKNEAWLIVEATGDPVIHLGFRHDVTAETLARWVRDQDSDSMIAAMNVVPVQAGDVFYVPAGLPHAIGAGIFLVELQEPTDLSVLLEWKGFDIDGPADGHLGLGFDSALACVDRNRVTPSRLDELRCHARGDGPVQRPFPDSSKEFFRGELLRPNQELKADAGFSLLIILDGSGELLAESGDRLALRKGMTVLTPHAAGTLSLLGNVDILRCRPPQS